MRCINCGTLISAGTDVCPNCDEYPYQRRDKIPPRRTPLERDTWGKIDSLTKTPAIIIGILRRLNKSQRKPLPWEK